MRAVLGGMPASVVVVTAYVGGRPWGVTASSFSAVALDPPTVSVCLFSHTALVQAAKLQGRMGISVLATDQVHIARAAAAPGAPKFLEHFSPEGEWWTEGGVPLPVTDRRWDPHDGLTAPAAPSVHGAIAHFDCWVSQIVTIGDHDVLFGTVAGVRAADDSKQPLVYARRNFYSLSDSPLEG
ncbi:MAG: flavin reductase [Actinomycetota bacterium]|nr:flavin reductase [Actinomycetota bacterium]